MSSTGQSSSQHFPGNEGGYSEAGKSECGSLEAIGRDATGVATQPPALTSEEDYQRQLAVLRRAYDASIEAAEQTAKLEREAGLVLGEKRAFSRYEAELSTLRSEIADLRARLSEAEALAARARTRTVTGFIFRSRSILRRVLAFGFGYRGARQKLELKALILSSGKFDVDWYRKRYPDVAASGIDPVDHYLEAGAGEGRDPGPSFSTRRYLAEHPTVKSSGLNPLVAAILAERQKTSHGESCRGLEQQSSE